MKNDKLEAKKKKLDEKDEILYKAENTFRKGRDNEFIRSEKYKIGTTEIAPAQSQNTNLTLDIGELSKNEKT